VRVEVPEGGASMEVDRSGTAVARSHAAHIASDGLLLYVANAAYERGTSPLSCWIPISNDEDDGGGGGCGGESRLDVFERCVILFFFFCGNGDALIFVLLFSQIGPSSMCIDE
jgi:hypothetical protein